MAQKQWTLNASLYDTLKGKATTTNKDGTTRKATGLDWFVGRATPATKSSGPVAGAVTGAINNGFDNTYDTSDYVNSMIGSGATGGTGGYYTLDIGGMLNAYEQQAAADRNVAKQTYDTARNDLLTSLKRFQEQNALDRQNQQRSYLSNQASLESAVQQADRQNRISAAARGIGGSGLQQLAQLQTLLSQGQNVSDMATQNQSAMDALKRALTQKEEDTNTNLDKILKTYNNALTSINAQLARNKADAEVARANSYVRPSGGSAGISAAEAASYGNDIANSLSDIVASYKASKNAYKGTDRYVTYNDALSAIRGLGLNQNSSTYKKAVANLGEIYKSKHNGKAAPRL